MQDKPTNKASLASWLLYIEKIHFNQIDLGLERVLQVKEKAGINPDFPIILVGGTNGKGSTCAFIESILNESNLKVGCYTSPHFINFNERIRINKNEASDNKIVDALNYLENKRENISLTYFELTTLAAVEVFIKEKVDIAILEVGLGGRLDAVNIFNPIMSIITSVSLDHQNYLGDTVEAIAYEKAGIFRPKNPAIINYKNPTPPLEAIAKKIQKAKTDPLNLPNDVQELDGRPEARNLINIYAALTDTSVTQVISEMQDASFKNFKSKLTELAVETLAPISQEINKLLNNPSYIDEILDEGSEKARNLSTPVVNRAYEIVGLLSTKK